MENLSRDEWLEFFRASYTQQQQQIDILMLLLKNSNEQDADFVDFAHNKKHFFLSDLTTDEFTKLMDEYRNYNDPS